MRIRKHALKILGTASSLPQPQSPPPLLTDVSPFPCICGLNQSPWDVIPSHPLHNTPEEDWMGDWTKEEEPISAITRSNPTVLPDDELLDKQNPAHVQKKVKKVKGKRAIMKKTKEEYIGRTARGGGGTYTCKKTDGKQWQCRQPVPQPNSLCDHHLAQIRSYNYKAPTVAKATRVGKSIPRKRVTMPTATLGVSDIYYYSSFGPWRGKQRGGGDTGQQRSVVADAESYREKESYVNMDVSEDNESWGASELDDTNTHMDSCKKRRRRKPMKSRSLKSLM